MRHIDWKNVGLPALLMVIAFGGFVAGVYFSPPHTLSAAQLDAKARQSLQAGNAQLAFASFSQRARKGDPTAQYWLGDLYQHGIGVSRDGPLAVEWLSRAAQGGMIPAERQLGEIYLSGNLVLQDFAKARKWLSEAALSGDATAQLKLGDIYVQGLGGAPDPVTGYAWYELSAMGGDNLAEVKRNKLLATMSPTQQSEGEAKARLLRNTLAPSAPKASVSSSPAPTQTAAGKSLSSPTLAGSQRSIADKPPIGQSQKSG